MKVICALKRVIDPYVKIRVRPDKQGVVDDNVKMVTNPFDEIALEEAIRWKEGGFVTEIIALSIGPQAVLENIRAALALGADSGIHVPTAHKLLPLQVAQCMQHIVAIEKPDIVIMGKQAIDDDANQTGQMLASLLDWPQATFASKVQFNSPNRLDVTREVDGGLETLRVQLPAVITTDLRLNEPRYPSIQNIMLSKKKNIQTVEISPEIDLNAQLHVLEVNPPKARHAGMKLNNVSELIHYLRNVEKII